MGPLVTVLMPVYNGAKYLKEAIDSILNQTYTNFEFLIIDDGSTDETLDIISSYNDKRIVLVHNEKNMRIVSTLNIGIMLTKGKYIARMDADDIAFSHRLMTQVDFLEKHPDMHVLGSVMELIDANGKSLNKYDTPLLTPSALYKALPFHNYLSHPSIMAHTEIFVNYKYRNVVYEDYDLWLRIANNKKGIAKINEPLGKYRIHASSLMGSYKAFDSNFKKMAQTKSYYLNHLSCNDVITVFNLKVRLSMIIDYSKHAYKFLKANYFALFLFSSKK